ERRVGSALLGRAKAAACDPGGLNPPLHERWGEAGTPKSRPRWPTARARSASSPTRARWPNTGRAYSSTPVPPAAARCARRWGGSASGAATTGPPEPLRPRSRSPRGGTKETGMTEAEWLTCEDPELMLGHLEAHDLLSARKQRLLDCACVRRVW